MAKRPPKNTIEQNILLFLQENEMCTINEIATHIDLQKHITEQLLTTMVKKGYVSNVSNKYYPNYLYQTNYKTI